MSDNIGEISIGFKANTGGLKSGTDKAREQLGKLSQDFTKFQATAIQSFAKVGAAAAGLYVGFQGISSLIGTPIKLAAQLETTTVSFNTLLGSASKAQSLLKELQEFGASTPFQFPEIAEAAKKLLAMGFESQNLTANLRMLGDISAGLNIPFAELSDIYGKIAVQGRVFSDDINQLQGRGIPLTQELAKQFGVAESEVKKLVESGQVGFPQIEKAIKSLTGEGSKFGGMMDAQSKTIDGLFSTLADNVGIAATQIGQEIVKAFDLKGVTQSLISFTENFSAFIKPMLPTLMDFAKALGYIASGYAIVKAATIAYAIAQKSAAIAAAFFRAVMSPTGLATVAAAMTLCYVANMKLTNSINDATKASGNFKSASIEAGKEATKAQQEAAKATEYTGKKLNELEELIRNVKFADVNSPLFNLDGMGKVNGELSAQEIKVKNLVTLYEELGKKKAEATGKPFEKLSLAQMDVGNAIGRESGATAQLDKINQARDLLTGKVTDQDLIVRELEKNGALPTHITQVKTAFDNLNKTEVTSKAEQQLLDLQNELDVTTKKTTNFQIELDKLSKAGAPTELIEKLKQVQTDLEKAKQDQIDDDASKNWVENWRAGQRTVFDEWRAKQDEINKAANLGKFASTEEEIAASKSILPDEIKELVTKYRSPVELIKDKLDNLKKFKEAGSLTDEEYKLGVARLNNAKKRANGAGGAFDGPTRFAQTAEAGSQAARDAILKARFSFPRTNDPQKKLLDESKKQTTSLGNIDKNTNGSKKETIVKIPA